MLEVDPSRPEVEVLAFPSPARNRRGHAFHVEAVVVVEVTTSVEVHDEDANRTAHSRSKSTTSLPTVLCETTIPEVTAPPAIDPTPATRIKGATEDASPIPHRLVSHRRVNSSPGTSLGQSTSTATETGEHRSPAHAADIAIAQTDKFTVTLMDEPCRLTNLISNLPLRANWKSADGSFEGCWGGWGNVLALYFDDRTVALLPVTAFRKVTGI